jgi:hypothetical protein
MKTTPKKTQPERKMLFVIEVGAQLSPGFTGWFTELTIENQENGQACLTGSFEDQAALFGVLLKLRDLSIPLISVNPLD